MREILFRAKLSENPITGKRIKNGEFVEGFYVSSQHDPYGARTYTIETDTDIYHVVPETVGQYIGKCDKNGKKIFEGDILISAWNTRVVIYFDEDYLQFRAREVSSYARENAIDYYDNGKMEVIGNIHDNPELLSK